MGVALIVVGPEKLPELAKSLAKGLSELKKTASALKENFEEEVKDEKSPERQLSLPAAMPPDAVNTDAGLGYDDYSDDAVIEGAETGGRQPVDESEPDVVSQEEPAGK